ncbi:putative component of anaerobic dehydrogenase [Desulfocapsa sulfexigens DSM 10523]|uniref:Putative component of anaerobic dehydrogenase n=1 Tax=Desulfocapsa sulfexigens (strain DSM 10523 / SB164P1) TaxID=1167006 RepID=M1PN24_DESSD|nr:molecular chaperone TorD family protein [Desulfocapsa sulfexigens]AGF77846.1 putative component of anaerobic dehydrogenase [Desulfocapsa sulfexigens DSM 10523]
METDLTDRDLCRVRLRFLDLLKSFFQDEPDADRLSRWRGFFAALDKEHIDQHLDTAIHELGTTLAAKSLQEIKDEHHSLFVDPYSKQLLPLNAAYYIDGKSYGPSLADFREILKQAQLVKESKFTDPEDSLPIMLDALITLINEEKQGLAETRGIQDQLLLHFLIPTTKQIRERISKNSEAEFYTKCINFLDAYLELEQGLLESEPETIH